MCRKCGEKFKYPYYLRVHICPDRQLSHEELRCVECNHQFTASKYYMRHFLRLLETSRFERISFGSVENPHSTIAPSRTNLLVGKRTNIASFLA